MVHFCICQRRTVRYGEELSALMPSVLDRAFRGEL